MPWASRSWKSQGRNLPAPSRGFRESMALSTPWLWTCGLQKHEKIHFSCFKPLSFMVLCYSSLRNLIHLLSLSARILARQVSFLCLSGPVSVRFKLTPSVWVWELSCPYSGWKQGQKSLRLTPRTSQVDACGPYLCTDQLMIVKHPGSWCSIRFFFSDVALGMLYIPTAAAERVTQKQMMGPPASSASPINLFPSLFGSTVMDVSFPPVWSSTAGTPLSAVHAEVFQAFKEHSP